METQTQNALTIYNDGFDADASDPTASPIKGGNRRFKDAAYFEFSERANVEGKGYAVFCKEAGWQKLEAGCPPEYLMRQPGAPKPPRPGVDEADWPKNFNGQPEHPWKWTTYLHLIDVETGEVSTFSTSTIGGNIAVGELADQIAFMRKTRPDAVPVVALESKMMVTQFGSSKPRPYFRILGWRGRGDVGSSVAALPAPRSTVELQRDNFDPPVDDFLDTTPEKPAVKTNGRKRG
jgi:hypothetical protein